MRYTKETTAFGEATDGGGMRAKDKLYVVRVGGSKASPSDHLRRHPRLSWERATFRSEPVSSRSGYLPGTEIRISAAFLLSL